MTDNLPSPVRDDADESYADVLAAREAAKIAQPLGDESALDMLAMRDHVIGLEAELANARAELIRTQQVARALSAELGRSLPGRLRDGGRDAIKLARLYRSRRAALGRR